MKVFISWSGERSKAVAELLDEWLQCVLQALEPWMSSKDIDRGSLWFSELSDQLSDTSIGIVCLSNENKDRPWILFESGALAKGLTSSRVCTFLIDITSTDVSNPLAQFNHTTPQKDGLFELVKTLNNTLEEKGLKESVLSQVFETYWPSFEARFEEVITATSSDAPKKNRSDENILDEVLQTVRSVDKRVREMEHGRRGLLRNKHSYWDPNQLDIFDMSKRHSDSTIRYDDDGKPYVVVFNNKTRHGRPKKNKSEESDKES